MSELVENSDLLDGNGSAELHTPQKPSIVKPIQSKNGFFSILINGVLFALGMVFPIVTLSPSDGINEIACFGILTTAVLNFIVPRVKWFFFGMMSLLLAFTIIIVFALG